ncbi:YunC family protein [Alicyclobacillus acidocaldarius]|uniref:DUF1805 domain-containing protein n=1 Tax=Alicyclobacillus acidocaldarius (strain Tc-4-1) TaxID=1048834 RepID=F8IGD4_ALIAT|nr:DUF1805 domain-containing protein [Alicyclobacillus acidocaldarius]AEJ43030.1 protein of unknown function DUF1805 [Alicyclobacillus acidocaldarius subsp. acidocaldarius Tc-4-1]
MVRVEPMWIEGYPFAAVQVDLPKTTLLVIVNSVGYAMCGALDVQLLRTKLRDRNVVAMRATGVRTLEELLAAPVESQTQAAEELGIHAGMPMREALATLGRAAQNG